MAKRSMTTCSVDDRLFSTLPTSETQRPGVYCTTRSKQHYIITQNLSGKFTLWKEVDGGYIKLDTAKSPTVLDKQIPWEK